jgi:hypothetical protein
MDQHDLNVHTLALDDFSSCYGRAYRSVPYTGRNQESWFETDQTWKSSVLAALFCKVEVHDKPVGKEEMFAIARSTSMSVEGENGPLWLIAQ